MKRKIRQNSIYLWLFFLSVFIFASSSIGEMLVSFFKYLLDPSTRTYITGYSNAFSYLYDIITDSYWTFDWVMVTGANLFQLLLPLYSCVAVILFIRKFRTVTFLEINRREHYQKGIIYPIVREAFKVSLMLFLAFCLFYLVAILLVGGEFLKEHSGRPLFNDWFGPHFYQNHRFLQTFLEGVLKFFYVPFIYCLLGEVSFLFLKRGQVAIFVPLLYFYILSAIGAGFGNVGGTEATIGDFIFLYVSPQTLMATGDFANVNTALILLINSLPLIIASVLLMKGRDSLEL